MTVHAQEMEGHLPNLSLSDEQREIAAHSLSPNGPGFFVARHTLDAVYLAAIQEEIDDPGCVAWRDTHDTYENKRGLTIVQNHDTYALRLHGGSQGKIDKVPQLRQLAADLQVLGQSFSTVFPSLKQWLPNEMSLHRYDDPEIGLSFHKDNLRFFGLVAIAAVRGSSDLDIKSDDGSIKTTKVNEGDLTLFRVNGLYPSLGLDANGRAINICPEHQVSNLHSPDRVSFMLRMNTKPDELLKGFEFDNWPIEE